MQCEAQTCFVCVCTRRAACCIARLASVVRVVWHLAMDVAQPVSEHADGPCEGQDEAADVAMDAMKGRAIEKPMKYFLTDTLLRFLT